jgi:hypothetical protein
MGVRNRNRFNSRAAGTMSAARSIFMRVDEVRATLDGKKTKLCVVAKPLSKRHPIVNLAQFGRLKDDNKYSGRFDDPASWGFPFAEDGEDIDLASWSNSLCPLGPVGSSIWVRETWRQPYAKTPTSNGCVYLADHGHRIDLIDYRSAKGSWKWNSPVVMQPWAARLHLTTKSIKVCRAHDVSGNDILALGLVARPHEDQFGRNPVSAFDDKVYLDLQSLWGAMCIATKGRAFWQANPWMFLVDVSRNASGAVA